jgi:hypothetical protein
VTVRVDGETLTAKSGLGGAPTTLAAFNRPPVMVFPLRLGIGSVLFRIVLFTAAVESAGDMPSSSAATPDTCGAAMDVPLRV